MNPNFSSIELRAKRCTALMLRLCASGVLILASMLLLTLSPQSVYGQG